MDKANRKEQTSLLEERVRELEKTLAAKEKICAVLMKRVERSMDSVGSAFSIFERTILLQSLVDQRTRELEEANRKLAEEITERTHAALERERLVSELQEALANVKALSGLLPICSSCKKIRDDKGYWNQIESYISQHSDTVFSHGLCPDCLERLYPGYSKKKK